MTTQQPVALRPIDAAYQQGYASGVAGQQHYIHAIETELRRLHARVQELESAARIECTRCGRILADVPPAGDTFAARWRNVTGAIKDLL